MAVEEFVHEGFAISIEYDDDPQSPRDWSNLGMMICFHNRYNLGDDHPYDLDNYETEEEFLEALKREHDATVILPLYLLDHSGLSMSCGDYGDPWDSGQVGVILDTSKGREELGLTRDRFGRDDLEAVARILESEVEVYDQYLKGMVYGYTVHDDDGLPLDSCWGYYGEEDAIADAKSNAAWLAKDQAKKVAQRQAEAIAASATYAWNGEEVRT